MRKRSRPAWAVGGVALGIAAALIGSSCGGSGGGDDPQPPVLQIQGNLRAIAGAASQRSAEASTWWQRLAALAVAPAVAQSSCPAAIAMIEACVETTAPDGNRDRECAPVESTSCRFDVSLELFEGADLFFLDVPSGRTAPIGGDVGPLANGCALLLCNLDLDFDRQVAAPELLVNTCANPDIPFDCGAIPTPTPRRGGGSPDLPTPAPTLPNLTPLPSVTPLPTATTTVTPNPTFTPIPTFTPTVVPLCSMELGPCVMDSDCCGANGSTIGCDTLIGQCFDTT